MFKASAMRASPLLFILWPMAAQADQSGLRFDYGALAHTSNSAFSVTGRDSQLILAKVASGAATKGGSRRVLGPLYGDTSTEKLKSLIARAEAPYLGYDAVVRSAWQKPPAAPTKMTIGEIYAWIEATPQQNHAIGRYQFIPATLRRLVAHSGLHHNAKFDQQTQDLLADLLLEEAGYDAFLANKMSSTRFMNRLARIWAGLPTSNGRSFYHGYAGNRATISWTQYETAMAEIFAAPTQAPAARPADVATPF